MRNLTLITLLVVLIFGCRSESPKPIAPANPIVLAPGEVKLPSKVRRGVCFAHSWGGAMNMGYGSKYSEEALSHLGEAGVDWVSLTPFGFMSDTDSTEISGAHSSTFKFGETDSRLRAATKQARQNNIKIMLKPHIWIKGGKWRGVIKPTDDDGTVVWDKWWDQHDAWIMHYANLAAQEKIESLVIGLELHTAVQARPDRLIALAAKVRAVYSGEITYSANWNEPVSKPVWEAMDSVGVQFYPPLQKPDADFDAKAVRGELRRYLDEWSMVAKSVGKPLVITEIGFRSGVNAAKYPNAWPDKHEETPDNAMQANVYKLFFEEAGRTENLDGLFLWKYFTDKDTDEEPASGFSPRGKPAEAVIRAAFNR